MFHRACWTPVRNSSTHQEFLAGVREAVRNIPSRTQRGDDEDNQRRVGLRKRDNHCAKQVSAECGAQWLVRIGGKRLGSESRSDHNHRALNASLNV